MTKTAHVFRELARNIYRYPGTALASLLSLTLLFLLFDLYWIAASTSENLYTRLLSEIRMEAFISEDVVEADIPALQSTLAHEEGVLAAEYISKEAARETLREILGTDLLVGYDTVNPLPRSFLLEFQADFLNPEDLAAFEQLLVDKPEFTDIAYSKEWLSSAEETRWIIQRVGLGLGILIVLTALISFINNIRLISRARAQGFQQMRLLGAGKLFLAFPFLLEGFLIGLLSAGAGWGVILYGKTRISLSQIQIIYPTIEEIAVFCGATAVLGALAGFLGIKRLLR